MSGARSHHPIACQQLTQGQEPSPARPGSEPVLCPSLIREARTATAHPSESEKDSPDPARPSAVPCPPITLCWFPGCWSSHLPHRAGLPLTLLSHKHHRLHFPTAPYLSGGTATQSQSPEEKYKGAHPREWESRRRPGLALTTEKTLDIRSFNSRAFHGIGQC